MGKIALVEDVIREGRRLLEELKGVGFPVESALWYYWPDSVEWRLSIASPVVSQEGPRYAYTRIWSILDSIEPKLDLALEDLSLTSSNERLVGSMDRQPAPSSARRDGGSVVGGVLIPGAYIYRLG